MSRMTRDEEAKAREDETAKAAAAQVAADEATRAAAANAAELAKADASKKRSDEPKVDPLELAHAALQRVEDTIRARAEVYRRDGDSARCTAMEALIEELRALA